LKKFSQQYSFSRPHVYISVYRKVGGFMHLLTYRELSKELSLSIRYLQKCVQEQGLHCIRFGKAVRFDPEDIAEWITKKRGEHAGVIQEATTNGLSSGFSLN
jgi:excisionase family DNA binding protein